MRYEPGDTVGPYRVIESIGEGATGVVYQVLNGVTGRLDAMKILTNSYSHDLEQAQRFLREIQVQAKLDHPNIAQVRTAFCDGQTIVLVMELVDGEPLNVILRRGPLPASVAVGVAEQVLRALEMAHHHGVVHRDVKPGNILLDAKGAVKLTDFGLAKQYGDPGQTNPGMAVGTVYYMAPEQVRGLAATDWRADLYAVGVVLYEMLTGRRPFEGMEQFAVMRAHVELVAVPPTRLAPHLPKDFDALLERALAKDPAQRFQSASGFLAALQALPAQPGPARQTTWQYAAYAAGLGALMLAAFARPPQLTERPIEKLTYQAPLPAPPPMETWRFPPNIPDAKPSPVAIAKLAAAVPAARPEPPPAAVPFHATRIETTEAATHAEPPPPAPVALPAPPKVAVAEPAPAQITPAAAPEMPTQKPEHWMRRTLGKVPKLFRRRD